MSRRLLRALCAIGLAGALVGCAPLLAVNAVLVVTDAVVDSARGGPSVQEEEGRDRADGR